MKIKRLETHDRLLEFVKQQSEIISQGASDCLKKNPLSLAIQEKCPYVYIFAFPVTLGIDEKYKLFLTGHYSSFDKTPEKKMRWQPRLTRPEPQTNSYLFRAQSNSDVLEICWILPPEEMWGQYKKGNITESKWVCWSIDQYQNNRIKLGLPLPEDLPDDRAKSVMLQIAREIDEQNNLLKSKQASLVVS